MYMYLCFLIFYHSSCILANLTDQDLHKIYKVDNTLGSKEWFDLDLWTCDLKNQLKATSAPSVVLIKWRGQKILSRQNFVYRPTDRPTVAKQHVPFFKGGRIKKIIRTVWQTNSYELITIFAIVESIQSTTADLNGFAHDNIRLDN